MKSLLTFFTLLLISVSVQAQPDVDHLQAQWMAALNKGEEIQHRLSPLGYLFYKDGAAFEIAAGDNYPLNGTLTSYASIKIFRHDASRYMSLGRLKSNGEPYLLLTGWKDTEEGWTREADIVVKRSPDVSSELSVSLKKQLYQARKEWVKLANRHDPMTHVQSLYTEDAVYFGNGTRSNGRAGIAERYSYMENPNYQVDLEASFQIQSKNDEVLEVGRYFTGKFPKGPGGLYLILWEKQASKEWLIRLDYNF